MIIDALTMTDFGCYSGRHRVDLSPKSKSGESAPIVLFGGMNGAGKTTILSALKLALYGKGVCGSNAARQDYQQYLRQCIHRSSMSLVQPTYAAVELEFRYAALGVISNYIVRRDWWIESQGKKVKEGLVISRDGLALSELTYDQAQSFLNELIPMGVSELFFFDGERIARLAEETNGDSLKEAINKLLGLDIIERLDSDLGVLVRTRSVSATTHERRSAISLLDAEREQLLASIDEAKQKIVSQRMAIHERQLSVAALERRLEARGGAWSTSRQQETQHLEETLARRSVLLEQLAELSSDLLPIASAQPLWERALVQIRQEQARESARKMVDQTAAREAVFLAAVTRHVSDNKALSNAMLEAYRDSFSDIREEANAAVPIVHALSYSQSASIDHRLTHTLSAQKIKAAALITEIAEVDQQIETISDNISRAPDESLLVPLVSEIGALREDLGKLNSERDRLVGVAKESVNRLVQVCRALDRQHMELLDASRKDRTFFLATRTRRALGVFAARTREAKLNQLQAEFFTSFNRLARKSDIRLSISVEPTTFEVSLRDESGRILDKEQLSAGEKQIYAIALLEALGRTSGRSLPVIIDTPLGRLDSQHRQRLVENYFPRTSHQVLIFSTDTEVDRNFYADLKGSMSHAYHLTFDQSTRSSSIEPGYFWREEAAA